MGQKTAQGEGWRETREKEREREKLQLWSACTAFLYVLRNILEGLAIQ